MTSNSNDLDEYFKCVARVFIVTLFVLSLICICCSCSSSRKTKSSSYEYVSKNSDSVFNSISFDRKWFEKYIESTIYSSENTKVTIYDTSLPLDLRTNKHPVVAEIEKSASKAESSSVSEISSLDSEETTSISQSIDSIGVSHEETSEDRETKSNVPSLRIVFLAIAAIAIILISQKCKYVIQDASFWLLNKIFK